MNLPTSFVLSNPQVDCLIAAGRKLLRRSAEYHRLLQELGGQPRPEARLAAEFPTGGCKTPN